MTVNTLHPKQVHLPLFLSPNQISFFLFLFMIKYIFLSLTMTQIREGIYLHSEDDIFLFYKEILQNFKNYFSINYTYSSWWYLQRLLDEIFEELGLWGKVTYIAYLQMKLNYFLYLHIKFQNLIIGNYFETFTDKPKWRMGRNYLKNTGKIIATLEESGSI